jgi:arylsulfatase A-like enzyme
MITRRCLLPLLGALVLSGCSTVLERESALPNVILVMSDDQGWGDAGYQGHAVLETPSLDAMAASGIRFDRFYSAAPVCSPTRGSCLTGRHPYRYGILSANRGHMPRDEVTLAEALKARGYATGHFGKWHLGTLTVRERDSNRGGPEGAAHYSPPWENGFDECFSTEAKVPTWNPMFVPEGRKTEVSRNQTPGEPYGTFYWTGPGRKAAENLDGDDSRVIMDRAIPFIRRAVDCNTPFFAVIWFHTPHAPFVAGPEHRGKYARCDEEEQHYFGALTAMDEQIGRLRSELRSLGAAEDTMLWFCSDNGPERNTPGTAGPLRERKRSLLEGGIRVPGLLEWPAGIGTPRVVEMPCCTSDYFPTVMDALGASASRHFDGISLLPLFEGAMPARNSPIGFESGNQIAIIDDRYKLVSLDRGESYALFDIIADPGETRDLAAERPETVRSMRAVLDEWRASCEESRRRYD